MVHYFKALLGLAVISSLHLQAGLRAIGPKPSL
jgi:hypothetical protein